MSSDLKKKKREKIIEGLSKLQSCLVLSEKEGNKQKTLSIRNMIKRLEADLKMLK